MHKYLVWKKMGEAGGIEVGILRESSQDFLLKK